MHKMMEFFTGDEKQLSMPRLLSFLSFFPATGVMVYIANTEALAVYLGAFVSQYGIGRHYSVKGKQNAISKRNTRKP